MIDKDLLKFCGKSKKYIFINIVLECIKLILGIALSYLLAIAIFKFFMPSLNFNYKFALALIFLAGCKYLLTRLSEKFNFKILGEVKQNLRREIYTKVLSLGLAYREELTTQELNYLSIEGIEQLENYYASYLSHFYYSIISSLILFLAFLPLDYVSGLILMIASLAIPFTLLLILRIVKKVQRKYLNKYAKLGNTFYESLLGLTTLKIYSYDDKQAKKMDEAAEKFREETMKVLAMQLNSIIVIDWISYGTSGIVLVLALLKLESGIIDLSVFLVILLLLAEFFVPMKKLTSKFHVAMTGVSAGEMVLGFLKKEQCDNSKNLSFDSKNNCKLTKSGLEEKSNKKEVLDDISEIKINNLSYIYPDGTKAIDDINIKLEKSKLYAFVGASGCGKSTLAGIISGELKSDKIEYKSFKNESLCQNQLKKKELEKRIVRISHTPHIFSKTIRENLLLGSPFKSLPESEGMRGINDKKMIEILKKLKIWDFLEAQNGLDTLVLSGAKNLSGGQIQRLAIARALLWDFDVYIFDEASSNVDRESEKIIMDIIMEIAQSKTVIIISHKLEIVALADEIFILDSGKVTANGSHDKLIIESNIYKELYNKHLQLLSFMKA